MTDTVIDRLIVQTVIESGELTQGLTDSLRSVDTFLNNVERASKSMPELVIPGVEQNRARLTELAGELAKTTAAFKAGKISVEEFAAVQALAARQADNLARAAESSGLSTARERARQAAQEQLAAQQAITTALKEQVAIGARGVDFASTRTAAVASLSAAEVQLRTILQSVNLTLEQRIAIEAELRVIEKSMTTGVRAAQEAELLARINAGNISLRERIALELQLAKTQATGATGVFGGMGRTLLKGAAVLTAIQAIRGTAQYIGEAGDAANDLETSLRKLRSTANITQTPLADLEEMAIRLRDSLFLSTAEAVDFTGAAVKMAQRAGEVGRAGEFLTAWLDLAAANGQTAAEALQGLTTTLIGQDEGLNRLGLANPQQIYEKWAQAADKTAARMTESEKAQAILNEVMEVAARVQGAYNEQLETGAGKIAKLDAAQRSLKERIGSAVKPFQDIGAVIATFAANTAVQGINAVSDAIRLAANNADVLGTNLFKAYGIAANPPTVEAPAAAGLPDLTASSSEVSAELQFILRRIELGKANREEIAKALFLQKSALEVAREETSTWEQRNKALEAADKIQAAFEKRQQAITENLAKDADTARDRFDAIVETQLALGRPVEVAIDTAAAQSGLTDISRRIDALIRQAGGIEFAPPALVGEQRAFAETLLGPIEAEGRAALAALARANEEADRAGQRTAEWTAAFVRARSAADLVARAIEAIRVAAGRVPDELQELERRLQAPVAVSFTVETGNLTPALDNLSAERDRLERSARALAEAKRQLSLAVLTGDDEVIRAAAANVAEIQSAADVALAELATGLREAGVGGAQLSQILEEIEKILRKLGLDPGTFGLPEPSEFEGIAAAATDIAIGFANIAEAIGGLDAESAQALDGVLQLAQGLENLAKGNIVSGIVGLISGGADLISGIFGGNVEWERIQTENNRRLEELRQGLAEFGRSVANVNRAAQAAAEIARSPAVIEEVDVATVFGGFNQQLEEIQPILDRFGVTFDQLNAIAEQNGIQLLDSSGRIVASEFAAVAEAAGFAVRDLTQFGKSISDQVRQMDLWQKLFAPETLGDPVAQLELDRQLLARSLGGKDIADQLNAFNLDTEAGREAYRQFLQNLYTQAESGFFGTNPAALGDFDSVQELMDVAESSADALNSFEQAVTDATASMLNVPTILNIARARWEAALPTTTTAPSPIFEPRPLPGTGVVLPPTSTHGGSKTTVLTIEKGAIVIDGGLKDADTIAGTVLERLRDKALAQSGDTLDYGFLT